MAFVPPVKLLREQVVSEYRGPKEISHYTWPGRGTTYTMQFEGRHVVEVYVTEKRKRVRVFVDGDEWKKVDNG